MGKCKSIHITIVICVLMLLTMCYYILNNSKRELVLHELHHKVLSINKHLADPKAPGYPFNRSTIYKQSNNFHWVDAGPGMLVNRITIYNENLNTYRSQLLKRRASKSWENAHDELTTLFTNRDDFMDVIAKNYPHVQTLLLTWYSPDHYQNDWSSLTDKHNLLVQKYYDWVGSEILCKYIRTEGVIKLKYDATYNKTCNTNTDSLFNPTSIPVQYFYGKPILKNRYWPNNGKFYPEFFYRQLPDFVFYINLIEDSIVTKFGDVISKNLKLVPYGCSMDIAPRVPNGFNKNNTPLYNEVFIISQYWGTGYFHKHVESMPRLAPYLEFLLEKKEIYIHVMEKTGRTKDTLTFLGIHSKRLISGVVRTNLVYLPQETRCGHAYPQTAQLFSFLLRNRLHDKFPKEERKSVVFVRRSGGRKFVDNANVSKVVETLATEYGFRYELFKDNPPPSYEEQMKIFNRAIVIVAPHGAGLANTIYSEPGTFVIESVCNPPHVNLCFQMLAVGLGHRYHGVVSRKGCERYNDVNITELKFVVKKYLEKL